MEWKDRAGNTVPGEEGQDRLLDFLYGTAFGRVITGVLVRPWVSKAAGRLLETGLSRLAIKPFVRNNGINMAEYEDRTYRSFNDFFTRRIRPGARPVDSDPNHLIAPCDSKLSVYSIGPGSQFTVKKMPYTLASLVRDEALARRYEGGLFLLFRLTVGDYHRYSYIESGHKGENITIPGLYYTVNPAACDRLPVYRENTREFTLIETERLGTVLQMEVGATMVGRIVNYRGSGNVIRGEEKGKFEFGGSTILVCIEKDRVVIDPDILDNTGHGVETVVKLGEKIGRLI